MTSAIDLANAVLDRLNGIQAAFNLPEMTDADWIIYWDSLRIPEALAHIDRCLNLTPEARTSMGWYIQEQEEKRAGLLEQLARLFEAYEAGDLDEADYERITTLQDYSPDHLRSLHDHVARFIPRYDGAAANGVNVYQLATDNGWVYVTCEDGQWIKHANYPYSILD